MTAAPGETFSLSSALLRSFKLISSSLYAFMTPRTCNCLGVMAGSCCTPSSPGETTRVKTVHNQKFKNHCRDKVREYKSRTVFIKRWLNWCNKSSSLYVNISHENDLHSQNLNENKVLNLECLLICRSPIFLNAIFKPFSLLDRPLKGRGGYSTKNIFYYWTQEGEGWKLGNQIFCCTFLSNKTVSIQRLKRTHGVLDLNFQLKIKNEQKTRKFPQTWPFKRNWWVWKKIVLNLMYVQNYGLLGTNCKNGVQKRGFPFSRATGI